MKNLSLRGSNNRFPTAAAIASREVIVDMVREILRVVGQRDPQSRRVVTPRRHEVGWVTIRSLEMQTLKLTIGLFTRVTLILLDR